MPRKGSRKLSWKFGENHSTMFARWAVLVRVSSGFR